MIFILVVDDFLSSLYHALRAARRRQVIEYLQESEDDSLSTRDLARRIASQEQEVTEQEATGEPYRNAYNALSQTHLPTLSDAGIIIYDSDRQTVRRGTNFRIATLLIAANTPIVDLFQTLLDETEEDGGQ